VLSKTELTVVPFPSAMARHFHDLVCDIGFDSRVSTRQAVDGRTWKLLPVAPG